MATVSVTRSIEVHPGTFRLYAMFDSEKKVLKKGLNIQPAQVISKPKLIDVESTKNIGSIATGRERGSSERKNLCNDPRGKKQSTDTTAVTKLLDSEVGHTNISCKRKRACADISEAESVVTHVDQPEPVKRVNCQKRQKIDNVKPVTTTTVACVDRSRGSANCQGRRLTDFTRASSVASTGRFSCKDYRPSPRPVTPATGDARGEGKEVIDHDVQMSPKRALRVAMLRTRFADTILKANNTLLFNGEKGDSLEMQREKKLFEKKQQEAKIIVAAEIASKKNQEAKLKMQRQRERETARIALEKMEKTVEFHEWQDIMMDFEMLINPQPSKNGRICF